MTEDAAFVQAIQADPDNDTARLVYADWLDERDDPRAAYLRLLVEAAALVDQGRPCTSQAERLRRIARDLDETWRDAVGKSYDVVLEEIVPVRKIELIITVRQLFGMSLAETKTFIESAPITADEGLLLEHADRLRFDLETGFRTEDNWSGMLQERRLPPGETCCRVSLRRSRVS